MSNLGNAIEYLEKAEAEIDGDKTTEVIEVVDQIRQCIRDLVRLE